MKIVPSSSPPFHASDNAFLVIVEALSTVRVARVAAGENHSVLCTAEGEVLTCGCGEGGKLGHGNERDVHVPCVVTGLAGKAVVAVAAGWQHSLALTVDGDLFSFGCGDDMQQVCVLCCDVAQSLDDGVCA